MSSTAFQKAHAFTAKWEGGLTNDAADAGGITNWGVSKVFLADFAKSNRTFLASIGISTPITADTIRKLTSWQGAKIFRLYFWDSLDLDAYAQKPATLLYDISVNHGRKWGVKLCQRGYNATGPKIRLDEDGLMGPKTRTALLTLESDAFVRATCAKRRDYYDAIVKNKPSQKVFLKGWHNRANALERYLLEGKL